MGSLIWALRCLNNVKTINCPYFFSVPGRVQSVSCQYNLKTCRLFLVIHFSGSFFCFFFRDFDCDCCPVNVVGQDINTHIAKRTTLCSISPTQLILILSLNPAWCMHPLPGSNIYSNRPICQNGAIFFSP